MKNILIKKLHDYLIQNNPDVLASLQGEGKVPTYLEDKVEALDNLLEQLQAEKKPTYIIEEICMDELTSELRPSRYNYLLSVVEDDFKKEYTIWLEKGTLIYEVINVIRECGPVFDSYKFSEDNEDNKDLRKAVTRSIKKYITGVTVDREYLDKINFNLTE